jgi:hypothetical protein
LRAPRFACSSGAGALWLSGVGRLILREVAGFILDGLLRRVRAAGRSAGELLGAGDVFRPWDDDGSFSSLPIEVDFAVLEPVRVAILDGHFSQRVARWPTIHAQLVGRLANRARSLSLMQAVTSLTRTHARLLLALWLVSERWGRVTTSGVSVTLPRTHKVLAWLRWADTGQR